MINNNPMQPSVPYLVTSQEMLRFAWR